MYLIAFAAVLTTRCSHCVVQTLVGNKFVGHGS